MLKRTKVVRGNPNMNKWESVWKSEEIRREIDLRRSLNRERRILPGGAERDEAWAR